MNISTLSRADLVSELLSPLTYPSASDSSNNCNPAIPITRDDPRASLLFWRLDIARELLLRDLHEQMRSTPIMSSPQALRDWLRLHCAGLEHEVFLVLYLDTHHRLIEAEELFRGTLTQTSVYPRELVKGALARNAAALVIAHNHPSGEAEPS